MNLSLATAFIFIVGNLNIYAQQNDTLIVEDLFAETVLYQPDDSLSSSDSRPEFGSLSWNPSLFGKESFGSDENRMILNPDKINTLKFFPLYSKFIIPTALLSYGIIARGGGAVRKIDHNIHIEATKYMRDRRVSVDNYLQFVPVIAVYGLDLTGMKAAHNFRDRTIVAAASYMIMGLAVDRIKSSIELRRPNNSNSRSFPSGHTATAFVGAHLLLKEYGNTIPRIVLPAYTIAAATGALRVLNNAHWASDVITGAGIGILSVEAAYALLPVFHKILGIEETPENFAVIPIANKNNCGVGLIYTF